MDCAKVIIILLVSKYTGATSIAYSPGTSTNKRGDAKHTECSCVCTNTTIHTTTESFEKPSTSFVADSTFETTFAPTALHSTGRNEVTSLKLENCNDVCDYVINGTLSDQPIGLSSRGSAAKIFPDFLDEEGVDVYCDCPSGSEKAWTVFQRRVDGTVDFYRYWDDYVSGFGNITGEFWLGLDWINRFTGDGGYELRVDLEDWEGNTAYAEYSSFAVENSSSNYVLTVDGFSGNAGDALRVAASSNTITNMHPFSTRDRGAMGCANRWEGAWWFNACFGAHLNGRYYNEGEHTLQAQGIIWFNWKGYLYSLKAAEMKFRPK